MIVSVKPILTQMIKKSKKISITTVSREVFILHTGSRNEIRDFCVGCEKEVEMLTLNSATKLSGFSVRQLVQFAENGEIHFRENETGNLFLCGASLNRFINT